ncbi:MULTISPECIES: FAD-dependent oxidoreductase [unclassified Streptomyces]|uniref:FAD-dependent oxidoreductase n=1 Tax=unclassified Streptomyces TaxID=2593676 RepID=UPI00278C2DFD|nr:MULTISPECIES: FAD-dependent oxidoreductase [unclassified Streptomyces]
MISDSGSEVIVVGGGVIGMSTALELARLGHPVRVWSRDAAERTTSAVAGGLWWPYRIDPIEKVGAWSLRSLRRYEEWAGRAEETGVRLVDGVHGDSRLDGLGSWAGEVAGMRDTPEGLAARLPLIDMPAHLAWLRGELEAAGVTVEARTVGSLGEAIDAAPTVVNCTGLAARELVPDDSVRPVRGQLVIVENPGVDTWFTTADPASSATTYFLPQPGRLLLGGTAQEDDWSLEPDPATAEEIVKRCARVRQEIAGARILDHRVGLRPARPAVRIEREVTDNGRVLVHNYGHGGAGVTVAWGCAEEAARLAVAG